MRSFGSGRMRMSAQMLLFSVQRNPAGATPTTRYGSPSSTRSWPTIDGSALKRVRQ